VKCIDEKGRIKVSPSPASQPTYPANKRPRGNAPKGVQPQEMDCALLNAERTRLLAQRDDLKSPLLSSNTDAEREAELTKLNGKLYTVEKAQFNKSCPAVANGPAGSIVR